MYERRSGALSAKHREATGTATQPAQTTALNDEQGPVPEATKQGANPNKLFTSIQSQAGETAVKDKRLGVALIGYAFMGKAHSNAWRNVASFFDVPAIEQKVLVGRDPEQVAEAAAKYGWAESATDWRQVLERDDIHIVDICAPGWMHAEIAIAALEAGKHVLVEKPLANTLAEAEAMTVARVPPARAASSP